MILLFSIWLLLVLVLSFWNLKWGVVLFLMYMVLVPYMKLQIGGFELGQNLFNTAFLASYFYYASKKKVKTDWRPLMPFIVYYLTSLAVMPFQTHTPFSFMLNSWRVSIMGTLFLPFVMWNVAKAEPSSVKLFRNAMLVAIAIAVGYGLYLTTVGGFNPYIMSLIGLMDVKIDMESYYEAEGGGRLFGRISSVFLHPMNYAFFLGLSFIYVFQSRQYFKKIIIALLLIAIGASAITCGVRSVLGGLVIAVAYYFLVSKNYKMMIGVIAVALVVYAIANSIPELSKYLGSMADVNNKKGDVSGSSIEMRLNQLNGAIYEGSKNPLFGLGYDWTGYYMGLKGEHPICLCFESLIYIIICNYGLFGFVIWTYMVLKYMKNNRMMHLSENVLFDCLIVFYISYSCITGEYGYMKLFLIFYVLMLCNQLQTPIKQTKVLGSRVRK